MQVFAGAVEPEAGDRPQTLGEEIANSVSRGVGALAALGVLPFLVVSAVRRQAGGRAVAGAAFFLLDHRWRYGHFVWHLFVLAGTTCHSFAVLWYAG